MSFRCDSPVLSAHNLATQLNQHLPIFVTAEVVQTHPKLGVLLEDLTQKITSNSLKKQTSLSLNTAETFCRHERLKYLEQSTLHLHSTLTANSDDVTLCARQFQDGLALSTLAVSLQLSPPKSVPNKSDDFSKSQHSSTFLSVCSQNSSNENTFYSATKSKTILEDETISDVKIHESLKPKILSDKASMLITNPIAKAVNDKVSSSLIEAWENITLFISPSDFEGGDSELQHLLSQLKEETSEGLKSVLKCSSEIQALVLQVDSQLVDYGEKLYNLIKSRRLSQHPLQQLMHLTSALHVKHYKLRCVELTILSSSYTPHIIDKLRSLKSRLSQKMEQTLSQLSIVQHKLEPYKSLDPSYLSLLEEYRKLKQELDFCKAPETS